MAKRWWCPDHCFSWVCQGNTPLTKSWWARGTGEHIGCPICGRTNYRWRYEEVEDFLKISGNMERLMNEHDYEEMRAAARYFGFIKEGEKVGGE